MLRRVQSKLYCLQPNTLTLTNTRTNTDQEKLLGVCVCVCMCLRKWKKTRVFSRGKLERALCRVALMVHNTLAYIWLEGERKKESQWRGWGSSKLACLFALLSQSYIAWFFPFFICEREAETLLRKTAREEKEREGGRCCLAMACCVVYTTTS